MTQYKVIEGFEDYEVSEDGHVRRITGGQGARLGRFITWHTATSTGYANVRLTKNGKSVGVNVHKLVSRAFLGPMPEGMQVRHLDGCKLNNHFSNLKYGTAAENAADRAAHGRNLNGEKNHKAKIDMQTAKDIRMLAGKGILFKSIAKVYGLSPSTVGRIVSGLYWVEATSRAEGRAVQ
jgi:hypothetical protein